MTIPPPVEMTERSVLPRRLPRITDSISRKDSSPSVANISFIDLDWLSSIILSVSKTSNPKLLASPLAMVDLPTPMNPIRITFIGVCRTTPFIKSTLRLHDKGATKAIKV